MILFLLKIVDLLLQHNPNELFQGFSHFTNDTLTFGYLAHLRFIAKILFTYPSFSNSSFINHSYFSID